MTWLWGGFSVDNPTLNRFFSLHYLLPFVIVGVVFLHVVGAARASARTIRSASTSRVRRTRCRSTPTTRSRTCSGLGVFLIVFACFVFFAPNLFGEPGQLHSGQSAGDAAAYRAGMVLPAVLRDPARGAGQARRRARCMFGSIVVLFVLAVAGSPPGAQRRFRPLLPAVLLASGASLRRAGLWPVRNPPEGVWSDHRAHRGDLVLPPLPRRPAAAWQAGAATAACRAASANPFLTGGGGFAPGSRQADGEGLMRRMRGASSWRQRRSRTPVPVSPLAEGMTLSSRSGNGRFAAFSALSTGPIAEARLPGLQGSLLGLPCDELLHYRNLSAMGFSADEIKAIAAQHTVTDGPNDAGEMYERPGRPADPFKSPFPNEQAARAANNGALPPDLTLIVEARRGGANHVFGVLTGYQEPPADVQLKEGQFYNQNFPGHIIAMPPPLSDGAVTYTDATQATVPQMAADISTFLAWAAEPNLEARKRMGVKTVLFLIVFTGLLYAVKRKIWLGVKH